MIKITTLFLVFSTLLLSPLSFSQNVYLSDQATVYPKPVRLPKYSDVIMRSLRFRPTSASDTNNTFSAMDKFHVTRLEWVYVNSSTDWPKINQTLSTGRLFGGSGGGGIDNTTQQNLAVKDLNGNPITVPLTRTWGNPQLTGCTTNPLFRDKQFNDYKAYLTNGALSLQRDNGDANGSMVDYGGCFCDYCMAGFSSYLATHATVAELAAYNITDPAAFNYKNYLISVNAPVGDAFKTFNGGRLKELFQIFQDQSTYDSYMDLRPRLNSYAKTTFNMDTVPMSINNGSYQCWGDAYLYTKPFDWAYSELITTTATPTNFYAKSTMARSLGKMQVSSVAKELGTQVLENNFRVRLNRKSIATAYATGGNMSVPWDVFENTPTGGDRYFGQPSEYADLYGFIRGAANYLDGYEDVAAAGKGIPVKTINGENVLTVYGDSVYAFARVKPNDHTSPIVIHLVNWKDAVNTATVSINLKYLFGGQNYTCKLLKPVAYNAAKHDQAEAAAQSLRPAGQLFSAAQSSAFSGLLKTITPNYSISANALTIDVDTLDRWNIIVLTPGTPTPPTMPNLISDGSFSTTAAGNLTLLNGSGSTNNARNVWMASNTATTDATLPQMGVTSGGATGNCGFFTRGTTQPGWTSVCLFQRLSATTGMSATKTYKLTAKLKSGATLSNGFIYLKSRSVSKFAVRADYSSGGTYAWCKNIISIPNTWTEYSQNFVFTNSVATATQAATPVLPVVPFTDAELNDLIVGFYSTTTGGTVYLDDVVLEEIIPAPSTPTVPVPNSAGEITTTSFKASWPAVTGAASYQVDIATDNLFNNILVSYSNLSVFGTYLYGRGLSTNTNYYFRVRAVDYTGIATPNSTTVSVTTLPIADMIVDGDFSATTAGNFSPLVSTGYVTNTIARGTWGGVNSYTTDSQLASAGVTTGGVTGNCAFFTPGTSTPSSSTAYLYQRLPNPTILITTKAFNLSFSLRADNLNVKAYAYIKSRPTNKYAVRTNWTSGNTYAWCLQNTNVPTTWTDYSQPFVFSKQVTSAASTSVPVETAFTESELNDLIVGFYSTGGKIYIDNVKFREDTSSGALTPVVTVNDNQLSTQNTDFLLINGNQISIPHFTGEPISVYNIAGQLVFKTNKQVFDMVRSGMYIVRMGNKIQRILIHKNN